MWHEAITPTGSRDNCTKRNSIITCKTAIAVMTPLLVHIHIAFNNDAVLSVIRYTISFFLLAQIYRHCKFDCVDSLIESSIPCKRTFVMLCFGVSLALHHFLPLLFRNFRFSHIIRNEWPKRARARAHTRDARISHSIELNGNVFTYSKCLRSFSYVCVCEIMRSVQQQRVMLMLMMMMMTMTMVGGWVGIRKCLYSFHTQNSWWDLEPDHYNAVKVMLLSWNHRTHLQTHIQPTKRTYNNVNVSTLWRHFKFVSWTERTYNKWEEKTVAHKRSGISVFHILLVHVKHLNLVVGLILVFLDLSEVPHRMNLTIWQFSSAFVKQKCRQTEQQNKVQFGTLK